MALFLCPFSWSWQSHTFQQLIALKGSQPAKLPSCSSCLASSVGQPCVTERGGDKNTAPKYGMARRVTGPLTAVRRVLVVPERLRANPDWSK